MKQSKKITILTGLLLCMGASTVMQTYFSSALPAISRQFQSTAFYSWVHVSYILASSAVILLSSSLCERFGNKNNFIAGSLLFGIGTLTAPFSSSMLQLIAARIIMGIGAGIVVPATYGIIGDQFEKSSYASVFAAFAVVQIITNGLGSLAGGYLPELASWQTIFFILLPIEIISFLLVFQNISDKADPLIKSPLKLQRHILMIAAILLLTLGIEFAYRSQYFLLLAGIALLFLVVIKDTQKDNAILPKEFLSDSLLRNLCLQIFLLGAFYNICLAYLPGIMQFSLHMNPDRSGTLLTVFVLAMGIGSVAGGAAKHKEREMIAAGWIICLAGSLLMKSFIVIALTALGLGSGILMSALLGYAATRTVHHAAGVNSMAHLIRNLGGSLGAILFQFTLHFPENYFITGITIIALSGTAAILLAFKYTPGKKLKKEEALSMKYVMKFSEIRKEDILAAGGKGANLGELFNAGFPVPEGFSITSHAFDEYMKRNGFDSSPSGNTLTSEEVAKGQLWKELEDDIADYYHALGPNSKVAVRSSATAEDLPEASFAGQQETYLNIEGLDQLYLSVRKCFASLFSSRATAYRKQTNFDTGKISLSVVVQRMVNSEISGVLFTIDPVSKNKSRMMLNASWGLGESIVSGKVTPDIYVYDRNHRQIVEKRLGDKKIMVCYSAEGTEERETSSQQRREFSLTDKQAIEIFELGRKTEQHFQCPQDMEWAISQNRLYLLQARPITTLNVKNSTDIQLTKSQRAVLNNWIEHCPTPLYPLDVKPCLIVDEAKNKVFHELGISVDSELTMADNGLLSLSAGKIHISPKMLKIPFLLSSFTDYSINSARTDESFHNIRKELFSKDRTDLSALPAKELIRQIMELMEMSEELAYTRFRYNIFPSVAVSKLIHHDLKKIDKNMSEYDLLSNLSYKTWDLNLKLKRLSAYIHSTPGLEQLFMELDRTNPQAIQDFMENQPDFKAKLQGFLNEFGWKSSSSYCAFGSVSWFENLDSLFSMLKVLQSSGRNDDSPVKFQNIMTKITTTFGKKKADRLKTKIEEIRAYHVNREESLYLIEMCYGLARRAAFELAKRFPQLFEQAEDIRYLTLDEVYELPGNIADLKELISVRKNNRQKNEVLWSGVSIGAKASHQNTLSGVSGNGGRCRGRVRKILTQQEFDKMQSGDILLCRYTDPSWTPLFVLASAVISDTGGPLSHSAIVAREYNIPAVLGIGNATDLLEDGDEVFVYGDTGKVILLTKKM